MLLLIDFASGGRWQVFLFSISLLFVNKILLFCGTDATLKLNFEVLKPAIF